MQPFLPTPTSQSLVTTPVTLIHHEPTATSPVEKKRVEKVHFKMKQRKIVTVMDTPTASMFLREMKASPVKPHATIE
jgi:hypothetical protein